MGRSVATWQCDQCKDEKGNPITQKTDYADMSVSGTPICAECGFDMIFDSEIWIKEAEE